MRVIVECSFTPQLFASMADVAPGPTLPEIPGFRFDDAFRPVALSRVAVAIDATTTLAHPQLFDRAPDVSTYLLRGELPSSARRRGAAERRLRGTPGVVGVFSDPLVETEQVCPGSPAVGDAVAVAALLDVATLRARGLTGQGVAVAVVDGGVNVAHLAAMGQPRQVDVAHSWDPSPAATPGGSHAVGHGSMCAFDAGIAAPAHTLLDHAVLKSTAVGPSPMSGLLSDAVASFARLRSFVLALPAARRRLVVSNSWGMYDPAWDFPPGHPGNYSDNPNHSFNRIVADLEAAGADILFAAGNCGAPCPSGKCRFATQSIAGANSHPKVLSVAGVDTTTVRAGYSSQGPGRLSPYKPDVCGYTHFRGSGYAAGQPDSGTSASCPVVAGVVAAVRTKYPATVVPPGILRNLVYRTSKDLGHQGWDPDHGWGVISPVALADAVALAASVP